MVSGEEDLQKTHWVVLCVGPILQKLNHFSGMLDLCRKKGLARCLAGMARLFPSQYAFAPRTYVLPDQLAELQTDLRGKKKRTIILKPDSGCQVTSHWLVHFSTSPKKYPGNLLTLWLLIGWESSAIIFTSPRTTKLSSRPHGMLCGVPSAWEVSFAHRAGSSPPVYCSSLLIYHTTVLDLCHHQNLGPRITEEFLSQSAAGWHALPLQGSCCMTSKLQSMYRIALFSCRGRVSRLYRAQNLWQLLFRCWMTRT